MTASIRMLRFACVILFVGEAGVLIAAPAGVTSLPSAPPPLIAQGSRIQVEPDEIRFAPVRGAHSKSTALLLNACRAKISKPVSMSVEWSKHYGRTGWWCRYQLRSAH